MATLFGCPQGHFWKSADGSTLSCPECGEQGQPSRAEGPDEATFAPGLELPPPPQQPAAAAGELPRPPGYEILSLLGRGGMGVVYKARQLSLDRPVALKMIRGDELVGPLERARFRAEAEAVAHLQHANIVQIYEIGEHQGRPFLALEFIAGGSLGQALAGHPLAPRAAASLVATLAHAVHHAHQRGIIHRDLKPANVLLQVPDDATMPATPSPETPRPESASTRRQHVHPGSSPSSLRQPAALSHRQAALPEKAIPKITDFGLAKRLSPDVATLTQTGDILGTPHYMAPEQATGQLQLVSSATDVYALGAILFELLTGGPPFRGKTALETVQKVVNEEPASPRRLVPRTPEDLATICLKCLEKDPEKRYGSALALAEDLERFLEGRPIQARPIGLVERTLKWIKRRPAAAGLIGVILVAAVSLLVMGIWSYTQINEALDAATTEAENATKQGKRASAHFDRARQAILELSKLAKEKLGQTPHTEKEQRDLLRVTLKFYDDLEAEGELSPEVRRDAARAYNLAAAVETKFGNLHQAEVYEKKSLATRQELAAKAPEDKECRLDLAESYLGVGWLALKMERWDQAEEALRKSLEIREALWRGDPKSASARRLLANISYTLGVFLYLADRMDEAKPPLAKALTLWRELHDDTPDEAHLYFDLGGALLTLGSAHSGLGDLAAAEEHYLEALDNRDRLQALDAALAGRPYARVELARIWISLGRVRAALGRLAEAEQAYRRALEVSKLLVQDFPSVPFFYQELNERYSAIAGHLSETGKDAKVLRREQLSYLGKYPAARKVESTAEEVLLLQDRGHRFMELEVNDQAAAALGKARELWLKLSGEHPDIPAYRRGLANVQASLALLAQTAKAWHKADEHLEEACRLRAELAAAAPAFADYQAELADSLMRRSDLFAAQDNLPEAERLARAALEQRLKMHMRSPARRWRRENLGHAQDRVALLAGKQKRFDDELAMLLDAHATFAELTRDFPAVYNYRGFAGITAHKLGLFYEQERKDTARARAYFEVCVEHVHRLWSINPDQPRYKLEAIPWHRSLFQVLAKERDRDGLAQAAQQAAKARPGDGELLFLAASALAACVPMVDADPRVPAAKRAPLKEDHAARSVALLEQALAQGFARLEELERPPFAALRDRADFQRLLVKLKK